MGWFENIYGLNKQKYSEMPKGKPKSPKASHKDQQNRLLASFENEFRSIPANFAGRHYSGLILFGRISYIVCSLFAIISFLAGIWWFSRPYIQADQFMTGLGMFLFGGVVYLIGWGTNTVIWLMINIATGITRSNLLKRHIIKQLERIEANQTQENVQPKA